MSFKIGQTVWVDYDNHWGGGCFKGIGVVTLVEDDVGDISYDVKFKKGKPIYLEGRTYAMKEYALSPIAPPYNALLKEIGE